MLRKVPIVQKPSADEKKKKEQRFYPKGYFRRILNLRQIENPIGDDYDIRLVIFRHAERIDHSLGNGWYKKVFGDSPSPSYELYANPHLPHRLPYRSTALLYEFDPPINRAGENRSLGKGITLARCNVEVDYCFSSPASRAVLTASNILRGLNQRDVPIKIEKSLFEPMNWNSPLRLLDDTNPFISKNDWGKAGHNVDSRYSSLLTNLSPNANEYDYHDRSRRFLDEIVMRYDSNRRTINGQYAMPKRKVTILIVAHAPSPYIFPLLALGRQFSVKTFTEETNKIPYLHCTILERHRSTKQWSVVDRLQPT